jgi:hypothetical protein
LPYGQEITPYYPETLVTIDAGSTVEFKSVFRTDMKTGKYDYYFIYDGDSYLIDPYWSASVSSSNLNHDYFFNGYVRNSPQLLDNAWTPTGELDWNKDGDFEVDGSSWDANLVAYYKFNEASGTTIYDSANGNNGTLTNGASVDARGMWDTNALDLDGGNDYVSIPDNDSLDLGQNLTLIAWIKKDSSYNSWDNIISKKNESLYAYALTMRRHEDDVRLIVNTTSTSSNGGEVTAGTWNHIVGTYDGSNLILYINGKEASSRSTSTSVPVNSNPVQIGAWQGSGSFNFDGKIDEVKIYNRALSQEEIIADYNSFLEAKFVDVNIVNAGFHADWNRVKINTGVVFDSKKLL